MANGVPVILVHGYLASRTLMLPMQWRLQRLGLDAHTVDSPFLNLTNVRVCARKMADEVERVLKTCGARQCDLVGVSLGGFMALQYVKHMGGAPGVRKLIAIGTPFAGTWASVPAVATLGLISRAAWQTLPRSDYIQELAAGDLPAGVDCHSIYASQDPVAPAHSCRLEGATNIEVVPRLKPLTHQGLILHPEVTRIVADICR
jgi:pimeloyl-ACP methyl ester carboxylesterase